ncbi:class I SAM-dependent methyltransferase [Calothrix sp. UHCC 0171]|uniref:class I SAM-dependent methyltransferase n=1 Tax=Calothrix sp. UHCC 0171 TaxID=3110245 RepID=UPI002B1FF0AE|nr:methyltransferase domain-containing protein [Calothrix sp. UHCC 0171]MEA5572648.1 methyltransferase domain-containing protein [Calothrix sp. UHCC 0171]
MGINENTIWERFLSPVVRLLIDEEALSQYSKSIDWERECDRIRRADVVIPGYYSSQNFHGIKGGYLTSGAAVTYDAVTQYVLPPHESWIRQALIDAVKVKPRRILDLGCGTGSTTLMLKKAFPEAEVVGLDLSPYMLVRAEHKAIEANLEINWRHGNAEITGFPDASFDLITASLLFHETPTNISQNILGESFRLLTFGGQILVLDGNQKSLRQTEWLNHVFEEPYIRDYGISSTDAWMGAAGFGAVQTQDVWWLHQVTSGVKPIHGESTQGANVKQYVPKKLDDNLQGFPAPAFEN